MTISQPIKTLSTQPMIKIPEELIEQVERENVLVFVGEHIGRDSEGLTLIDYLTDRLIQRSQIDDSEEYTFPEAAQLYEDQLGRHALVQFVRDQLDSLRSEPQQAHHLIARLTMCNVLATTCLDQRLEQAFAEADRPLDVVINNEDIPFVSKDNAQLYKLRGSVERLESLVLTEDDYASFFDNHASISLVLQSYLVRKTIVFAGYDLTDPNFQRLYLKVTAPLDTFARRAYAFGEVRSAKISRWCKRNRIEVVEIGATAYLEELTGQLASRSRLVPIPVHHAPGELAAIPIPLRPYKLLDYYETKDRAIFFGREQETIQLISLIHAHRLVLLYGASGVGKTSLLLAGALPELESADPPYEVISVRSLEDPRQVIRESLRRHLAKADLPSTGSLTTFLIAVTQSLDRPLVILLDQFEEFFTRCSSNIRAAFISELGTLYDARDVPVKVVISLREDWLASVSEIEARIPEVYRIKMRLLPLTVEQTRLAILAPAKRLGVTYEPALLDQLLADLVKHPAGDETASVLPTHLQLVCDALYRRVRQTNRLQISMADYEAIGGATDILARYIEESLAEHSQAEREVAKRILIALVTSQMTKSAVTEEALMVEVGVDAPLIEQVLTRLIRQRLVRRLRDGQIYELAHDVLAIVITSWIDDEDRQFKQAHEFLRQELADWKQDPTVFLSQTKFQRINALRLRLRLTDEEKAFLLRAAVYYDDDVPHWLKQISQPELQAEILLDILQNDVPQARISSAKYLAQFPRDDVTLALAQTILHDPDPEVRDRSAVSLGRLGIGVGISHLIEVLETSEDNRQPRVKRALARIIDVSPEKLAILPRHIRQQAYYDRAQFRLRQSWPRIRLLTASGAVGGAVGFAFGLTPLLLLNQAQLSSGGLAIGDALAFTVLFAILGLVGGACVALGISAGETLFRERIRAGRIIGGVFVGWLSFAFLLSTLSFSDGDGFVDILQAIVGSGFFGMLTALGITIPLALRPQKLLILAGGAIGAALGILVWGLLGFAPGQAVPLPVSLLFGGLVGLILAWSIIWAETRWNVTNTKNELEEIVKEGSPPHE